MYAILWWTKEDYVTCISNEDGSVKLFETIREADKYANELANTDDVRVISIEGLRGGE